MLVAAGRDAEARQALDEAERVSSLEGSTVYLERVAALREQLAAPR